MIKVLIVDDSAVSREYLRHIIGSDPELEVVGMARDGREAVELVRHARPDVVTMDIQMPRMDGYEATRHIMERSPVPIVVISTSMIPEQVENTFRAIRAGAVAALEKPKGPGNPESERMAKRIVRTVRLMAEVRVVRRYPREQRPSEPKTLPRLSEMADIRISNTELVVIGASTGGPSVIRKLLSYLDRSFPVPLLLVQHIAPGFLRGMADWLGKETGLSVRIPEQGERALPGCAYFAPDGWHMGIAKNKSILLEKGPTPNGPRPSVSHLFRSAGDAFGARVTGILLTGMGKDGARELGMLREKGALTVAQDRESSVVHGMPGEAIRLDAAAHVFSPEEIVSLLLKIKDRGRGG